MIRFSFVFRSQVKCLEVLIVKLQSMKTFFGWIFLHPASSRSAIIIWWSGIVIITTTTMIIVIIWSSLDPVPSSSWGSELLNLKLGQGDLVHLVRVILVQQIFHLKHNSDWLLVLANTYWLRNFEEGHKSKHFRAN